MAATSRGSPDVDAAHTGGIVPKSQLQIGSSNGSAAHHGNGEDLQHKGDPNQDRKKPPLAAEEGWDPGSDEDFPSGPEEGEEKEEDEEDTLVLEDDPAEMSSWAGQPSVKGSSGVMQMVLLAFNSIGISFTWGVEMTYCTPYLLSLGLTKGQMSMVWIAGPLSGLIVQPVIGVISDGSRSRWGRRRPFIAVGSVIVALAMFTLGFTKEIVGVFISDKGTAKAVTIVLAVLSLYTTDFAINAVMSCSRSLIVDTLPMSKQQAGAAWASRMGSIGHITGYGLGAVDLVRLFGPTFGDTQFKQLTLIASLGILFSSSITCWAVTERVLISVKQDPRQSSGSFKIFRQIWSTLLSLPPRIQAICWAVFWSWIGWFPFLFYSSTWVGETYFRFDAPADAEDSKDALGDMGRIGSTALAVYSCITVLGAWVLPLLVRSPDDDSFTRRPPKSLATALERINKLKPDLLTVWIGGHLMFAGAMSLAPFAASFRFATVLVAICGVPWTIAMWAPATFLGVEVNKLSGGDDASRPYRRLSNASAIELATRTVPTSTRPRSQSGDTLRLEHGPEAGPAPPGSTGELSGVYFGILNIYTTLPQFVGTFISTIVFAVLEPGKSPELATDAHPSEHHGTDGPNAIAVCLFIGAMSAVGAAYATRRLKFL